MLRHAAQSTAIGLLMALALAPQARAGDRSFCYTGPCHNFHGEAEMIEALRHIDRAYRANCRSARIDEALAAREHVFDARREVCLHEARAALHNASCHLQNFLSRDDWRELAAAADQVHRALQAEQSKHVVVRPTVPVSFAFTEPRCGFPGESHVIEALDHMDHAYRATCRRDRIVESIEAKRSVIAAHREFCDPQARRALIEAVPLLSRYGNTGELCLLERAAALLHEALRLERRARDIASAPRHYERLEPRSTVRNRGFDAPPNNQNAARTIVIGGKTFRLPY